MKTRACHVSNSSTSSFIINYCDWLDSSREPHLTDEQIYALETTGFKRTWVSFPQQIEAGIDRWDEDGHNFAYHHLINHDEVFTILIQYKIPFHGCCHYGSEEVFWDGKSQDIIFVRNTGQSLIWKGRNDRLLEELEQKGPIMRTEPISDYYKRDTENES